MGVPDDANPLNRRLPAEVISRVRKPDKNAASKQEEPFITDRPGVLALNPDQRLKWLSKALQKCQDGKLANTLIYDIVTQKSFASGMIEKVGMKMHRAVRANLSIFSQKQQRFLQDSDAPLVKLFGGPPSKRPAADAEAVGAEAAGAEAKAESAVSLAVAGGSAVGSDNMMARVLEFARQKEQERGTSDDGAAVATAGPAIVAAAAQAAAASAAVAAAAASKPRASTVGGGGPGSTMALPDVFEEAEGGSIPKLWERLAKLAPAVRAEVVGSLDTQTKELLEEFLEARIARAGAGAGASSSSGGDVKAGAGGDAGEQPSAKASAKGAANGHASKSISCSRSRKRSQSSRRGRRRSRRKSGRSHGAGSGSSSGVSRDKAKKRKHASTSKKGKDREGGGRRGRRCGSRRRDRSSSSRSGSSGRSSGD